MSATAASATGQGMERRPGDCPIPRAGPCSRQALAIPRDGCSGRSSAEDTGDRDGAIAVRMRSIMLLGATWAVVLACVPAARASDYPVVYNWPAAIIASEVQATPPGANDWTCRPTASHPLPVVLVPGLSGNGGRDYYATAPLLANHGYCVFMFDYRDRGQESIEDAAAELSPFIDRVLSTTGAARVDVVGHSQGGMTPRYYMKFLGGA